MVYLYKPIFNKYIMKTIYLNSNKLISIFVLLIILQTSSFSQDLNPSNWPNLKGYWKFQDTTNLTHATVGSDLILLGQQKWVLGASFGDTAIRIDTGSYYKCYHNIQANGGGDSVNRYSLMFDFRVPNIDTWHSFFQTDTTNQNDGDCFIRPNTTSNPGRIGVGYTGYSNDSILPGEWYRLVITVNLGNYYNYYLNGNLLHIGDTEDIFIDKRFALTPAILFFADDYQEDGTIEVASLAIFDTCLTPTQISQLGTIEPCIANPPFVNIGHDTMPYYNSQLILNAGNGFKNYLWSTGDTLPTISLDSNNVFGIADTIWVKITDMNNCQASDSIIVEFINNPGFGDLSKQQHFSIFPNPNSGVFKLNSAQSIAELSILNSRGQIIRKVYDLKAGISNIDISDLSKGLYYLKINSELQNAYRKLIILK